MHANTHVDYTISQTLALCLSVSLSVNRAHTCTPTLSPQPLPPGVLASILDTTAGSVIACPSTNAMLAIDFSAPVVGASVGGLASVAVGSDGATVVFDVASLEDNPTEFTVELDLCGQVEGADVVLVADAVFMDVEGNTPDLSVLEGTGATVPDCDGGFYYS